MGNVERLPIRTGDKVAVLLNGNAKAVTESLRRELENFVPSEDLYFSRSLEDAQRIVRTVLDKGYRTVLTGGGDGTFCGYVNCLLDEAMRNPGATGTRGSALRLAPLPAHSVRLPRVGVLKLGTGNAVAEFAGSSSRRIGVVEDILRSRSGEVDGSMPLHLLMHGAKRAPFAGLGIDAAVLNDYVRLKSAMEGRKLEFMGVGGMGYFLSVMSRTIPSYMLRGGVSQVEVVNLGAPARQIGPDGKPLGREIEHGEILYKGPCKMAAVGTVPFYGFGFQMFPYALQAPGRFQLRLTAIGVPTILRNLRTIWRGGPPPAGVLDFHAEKVLIRFDREMPLQVGGDAEGYRREVVFEMAERPLELLDFRAKA